MAVVIKGSGSIEGSTGLEMGANGTTEIRGQVNVALGSSVAGISTASGTVSSGISTATNFAPTDIPTSNRRINMNGAMQVWQRSTSASDIGGSNGYFAADRYRSSNNGSGRHTISRDTSTPNGFGHSMKIDVTTAVASPSANNYMFIQHRIEGQDVQQFAKGSAAAKQYALSFWVKSPKTGVHVVQLEDVENSRSVQGTYTIASADTWEKHTIIYPADTTGGITCDNAHRMQLYFWLFAGSTYNDGNVNTLGTTWATTGSTSRASGQVNCFDNTSNNWYITGIQLEVGPVATPFEHRSYGDELSRCQRYYEQMSSYGQTSGYFAVGYNESTTQCNYAILWKVEKRTTPGVTTNGDANFKNHNTGTSVALSNLSIQAITPISCRGEATSSSAVLTDGGAAVLASYDSDDAIIKIDAEL